MRLCYGAVLLRFGYLAEPSKERRVKPKPSEGQDTELVNTREHAGGGTRWGRPLFCRIYIITGNYEDDEGE